MNNIDTAAVAPPLNQISKECKECLEMCKTLHRHLITTHCSISADKVAIDNNSTVSDILLKIVLLFTSSTQPNVSVINQLPVSTQSNQPAKVSTSFIAQTKPGNRSTPEFNIQSQGLPSPEPNQGPIQDSASQETERLLRAIQQSTYAEKPNILTGLQPKEIDQRKSSLNLLLESSLDRDHIASNMLGSLARQPLNAKSDLDVADILVNKMPIPSLNRGLDESAMAHLAKLYLLLLRQTPPEGLNNTLASNSIASSSVTQNLLEALHSSLFQDKTSQSGNLQSANAEQMSNHNDGNENILAPSSAVTTSQISTLISVLKQQQQQGKTMSNLSRSEAPAQIPQSMNLLSTAHHEQLLSTLSDSIASLTPTTQYYHVNPPSQSYQSPLLQQPLMKPSKMSTIDTSVFRSGATPANFPPLSQRDPLMHRTDMGFSPTSGTANTDLTSIVNMIASASDSSNSTHNGAMASHNLQQPQTFGDRRTVALQKPNENLQRSGTGGTYVRSMLSSLGEHLFQLGDQNILKNSQGKDSVTFFNLGSGGDFAARSNSQENNPLTVAACSLLETNPDTTEKSVKGKPRKRKSVNGSMSSIANIDEEKTDVEEKVSPALHKCKFCGVTFSVFSTLQQHEESHHKSDIKCNYCYEVFTDKDEYQKHVSLHRGEENIQKCSYCDKIFLSRGDLQKHLSEHTQKRPYKCEHCDKCFRDPGSLQKHERIHTGERPFECKHCPRAFAEYSSLRKHMRVHTGEQPYKCDRCGKAFSISGNLARHLFIHSGERPYGCVMCSKRFNNPSHLRRHVKNLHGDSKKDDLKQEVTADNGNLVTSPN